MVDMKLLVIAALIFAYASVAQGTIGRVVLVPLGLCFVAAALAVERYNTRQ